MQIKHYKGEVIYTFIVCLLLPPSISTLLCLHKFIKKGSQFGIIFFIYFVLFLTYNFFSIDNCYRFFRAHNLFISDFWYLGDPLTYLIKEGINWGLECSHFFYLYILFTYIFWFLTFKNCNNQESKGWFVITIIGAMILRNAMDLLYYTLSLTFLLFMVSKKENIRIKDYIYIIPIIYLLHPGVLLILCPSAALYYIFKNKKEKLYPLYLIVLFLFTFIIRYIPIPTTGISIIDNISQTFISYTSDENEWGIRQNKLSGLTYFIQFYCITVFYFIIFILSIYYRKKIKQKFILAIFQCTIIMLPNFWIFVTLTERFLVVLSLTSFLCLISILPFTSIRIITKKSIAIVALCLWAFNTFRASKLDLSLVFNHSSYTKIQQQSYYIPSILLIDYKNWGFSDSFIKQNSSLKDKIITEEYFYKK